MDRDPYVPPMAPVESRAVETGARWKWLCVPVGHAAFTLSLLIAWWWLEPRPPEAPTASLVNEAVWIWEMVKEALFQGGVLLVATVLALWAVPPILVRHAIYISMVSAVAGYGVYRIAYILQGRPTTNGEHLDRMLMTYGVVLLVCSVAIRIYRRRVA